MFKEKADTVHWLVFNITEFFTDLRFGCWSVITRNLIM
jgi:hypothetical protein